VAKTPRSTNSSSAASRMRSRAGAAAVTIRR
jgi:hypothetical protein